MDEDWFIQRPIYKIDFAWAIFVIQRDFEEHAVARVYDVCH
jgi:hypothetical protein